jgi:hypothetical protein
VQVASVQLTAGESADCVMALPNAHAECRAFDAAMTAIDKAIALLKPGDKSAQTCESLRADFRGKLLAELVEELPRSGR